MLRENAEMLKVNVKKDVEPDVETSPQLPSLPDALDENGFLLDEVKTPEIKRVKIQ